MKLKGILSIALFSVTITTNAWFDRHGSNVQSQQGGNRAGCAPAVDLTHLQLNNVKALIETGGSMWQDRSTGNAAYIVPKNSGLASIYSGALWMGGEDVNGQLKLAALTFRQGNDFWTGPLTTTGDAEIDAQTCTEYDKFFVITRAEVAEFSAWWECANDINGPCDENALFPAYSPPASIQNWPGNGDLAKNQALILAPFYDRDGDDIYDWNAGDFPWYDIKGEATCGTDRTVTLYGDQTYWWIFNDKGNIHTETNSDPIGMEIKAQAFAFTTNDEVNDMTFYNYELINRSTQTLQNTYFGQWVDSDIGCYNNDYVGCDVKRGLGYGLNGEMIDLTCTGAPGYGADPPAIGVDFFEGPYKDNDGIDNPGPTAANNNFISYNDAVAGDGIVYKGMGIGYGDGVVDNERFGMRKFLYYTSTGPACCNDPNNGVEYYKYIQGIWKDGSVFLYGGDAHFSHQNANPNIPCDYMFPGDSDPIGFGAGGLSGLFDWSEATDNNPPGDRRFMQSAGPFTLEPGAINNITVGVVYARASGGLYASVDAVRLADDKAQALFDNCFQILEGPDAPDVSVQELDKELILYISNPFQSNNYNEDYVMIDPFIITPDSLLALGQEYDNLYQFEGYQVYQLKNKDVSVSEIGDVDLARLVAQCDVKNGITQLINWEYNKALGVAEPTEMVNGQDEGIKHSFRITEDLFATGDRNLINYKTYYFLVTAYGYNNYQTYNPGNGTGQAKPYLASRKNAQGGEVKVYSGIPHIPTPEANGTYQQAGYGDGPEITRIEGEGNGGLILDLTPESEAQIVSSYFLPNPTYKKGKGPINVKVIDPLNVVSGNYKLNIIRDKSYAITQDESLNNANWELINLDILDTVNSEKTILVGNEQLIPEWGISVEISQVIYEIRENRKFAHLLQATIEYDDSSRQWLGGVPDDEGVSNRNWIRSGESYADPGNDVDANGCDAAFYNDYSGYDNDQEYEKILGGTWSPFFLCGSQKIVTGYNCVLNMPIGALAEGARSASILGSLQSVDIVFTNDKSLWTRCVIVEMHDEQSVTQGGVAKHKLRAAQSVDKNGNPDGSGTTGMGWFPGYAIDIESGERLNMAFGEDSYLAYDNGRDMKWNPTSTMYSGIGEAIFGGKHYVYVFRNDAKDFGATRMPYYDEGAWMYSKLVTGTAGNQMSVWRSCIWVGMPMLNSTETLLSNDARIKLRVEKAYDLFATSGMLSDSIALSQNNWNPVYQFNTENISTVTQDQDTAYSALDLINVVPNPYYAFSKYETNRIDNRVKFTNLPEKCVITIYTSNGTLVRQFTKDDPLTYMDWDLKNFKGIPISSGTYIIHIKTDELPENGDGKKKWANERVLKWFGVLRPPDLENL